MIDVSYYLIDPDLKHTEYCAKITSKYAIMWIDNINVFGFVFFCFAIVVSYQKATHSKIKAIIKNELTNP